MKELMKYSMSLRSYGTMCVDMVNSASCHCQLRQQTPCLSPKPTIAQSIEDIIICVLMQKLSPNVGYCCSYGLARIDAVMMGFGGNVCQAITLSISVQSCWLLSRNVDHDII